jgi:hypothetical protein
MSYTYDRTAIAKSAASGSALQRIQKNKAAIKDATNDLSNLIKVLARMPGTASVDVVLDDAVDSLEAVLKKIDQVEKVVRQAME